MAGTGITAPAADTPRPVGIFDYGDLTDHLPEPSAERLRKFRQHVTDRRNLIPEFAQIRAVSEDRTTSAKRIEQLVGHRSMGPMSLARIIPVSVLSAHVTPSLMPSSSASTG